MRSISLILFFVFASCLLIACESAEPETVRVEVTVIAEVPVTVEVTRKVSVEVERPVEVTRVLEVTRLVELRVTVTPTMTPQNSPTPSTTPLPTAMPTETAVPTETPMPTNTSVPTNTPVPTETPVPTATPDIAATATVAAFGELAAPKGNGFYTVGVEILPGLWRSEGRGSGCYWARYDGNQELLDNHFGNAGGTVAIRPNDFEVEFDDCGTWIYVENETAVLSAEATDPKGDGFFTVGVEIAPGLWESTGTADDCYWARLTAGQDIIDNHFGNSGGSVRVAASDYEVQFEDCGVWEYRGQ